MATNRRLKTTAPVSRWDELGRRLRVRREEELGYQFRPQFEEATGLNYRMISDIENSPPSRANTYLNSTLREIARAYAVTYDSMIAFLKEEADDLDRLEMSPAAAPPAPLSFLGPAQLADNARSNATRPHAQEICEGLARTGYLREVAPGWFERTGAPEPSGAELFGEGTPDARTWDDPNLRGRLTVPQMVWLLAEMRRIDAERAAGRNGSAVPGA